MLAPMCQYSLEFITHAFSRQCTAHIVFCFFTQAESVAPNFSLHGGGGGTESEAPSSDDDEVPGNFDSSDDETLTQLGARLSASGTPQSEYVESGEESESVPKDEAVSSDDESLARICRTTKRADMSFDEYGNDEYTNDEYTNDEYSDDESSDGRANKYKPQDARSASKVKAPGARSRAGARTAKPPIARSRDSATPNSATEQPHKYKSIMVNGKLTATTNSRRSSGSIARAPASQRLPAAWGHSSPTSFAGRASRTGRTRGSSMATRA
jgi:hypothetical protein